VVVGSYGRREASCAWLLVTLGPGGVAGLAGWGARLDNPTKHAAQISVAAATIAHTASRVRRVERSVQEGPEPEISRPASAVA
jgi:hypothetical protein